MKSESKIIVRYQETDKMGIVHHSVYPIWYEVARTDYIKILGITYSKMEALGVMTPIIEVTSKYSMPAYYEDELKIEVQVIKITPARIVFEYKVYKKGLDKPINIGTTMHAWVGKDMKPINMKKHMPELYIALENAIEK